MKIFGLEFKFNGFDIWHKGNMGSGSGLDSDKLDGKESSDFATAVQGDKADNALPAASYTASDVLVKLKTVDGSGSGLDADTLDSIDSIRMIYGMNGSGSNIPSTTQNVYDISQYKSGFWNVSGAPWTPTTDWYWGATFAHTGNTSSYNYAGQLIFRNSYGGSGLYARTISAGTPSAWSKLWSDRTMEVVLVWMQIN
jgi:hypothetical protein